MEDTAMVKMREMVDRLNKAADAYYNGRNELMTDYEWDALFDQLKKLEEETGIVLEDSPTRNVSADDIAGQKEAHEFAALSLAKTKNPADLVKWADGRKIWISWKLDGLTLVATYDRGRLSRVVTRGDGHTGTNITHLAPAVQGIPDRIPYKGHLVIRGEAVISYADFEQFLMESDEDYANPRNLASGSLTLKDPEELRRRKLRWIPFTLVHADEEMNSWGERMHWLQDQGFSPVESEAVDNPRLEEIQTVIDRWTQRVTDGDNPYPVDGLVIVYDDTAYAAGGSVTGHHATRAGYAFKWQDEAAQSTLQYIEWSCAASTITPVAVFEPVQLEGTVVKRASLCNISECERLGIGGKGTEISVIKANKIIPKVIRVSRTEGALEIPAVCPVCGRETEIRISPASGTKTLRCTNPGCPAKQLKKFTRFVSKGGMDIDGISEATLSRFVNEGWISGFSDIYRLPEHRDEISTLEGFGEKSADNLMNALSKASEIPAGRLIYALSIPLIGPDVAARLLSAYSFADLVHTAETAEDPQVFAHVDGIGPEKSTAFVAWFKDPDNVEELNRLLALVRVTEPVQAEKGDRTENLTFVVTGDVHIWKNRNELKAYIESQGGKVTGSVSKSTDYLINNDLQSVSSKNRKAKELGIPIISEEEFMERFGKVE
ncbi:MAG: NAD-dependent DNA ligase LigA [Erysipelotrichaceae bacterium]|nr:NAD-dependent DNA ligase LigA [Erysipelotrichaceae bacterium]